MAYEILREGDYQIHRIHRQHHVLRLDDDYFSMTDDYFTIAEGSQGELSTLVRRPRQIEKLLREGRYRLIQFRGDPQFQDVPYLFLQQDGKYREMFLPSGLPRNDVDTTRYIYSDHTIDAERLKSHLDTQREVHVDQSTAEVDEPPVEGYYQMAAGDLAAQIREMPAAELRKLEEYERRHKNRTTVLNTIRSQKRS